MEDKETYEDQNKKADAVFDIKNNKFVKRPEDFTFKILECRVAQGHPRALRHRIPTRER